MRMRLYDSWEWLVIRHCESCWVVADGSKYDSGTGSEAFSDDLSTAEFFRLLEFWSMHQSEVLAVKKAAEQMVRNQISDKDISIYIMTIKQLEEFFMNFVVRTR